MELCHAQMVFDFDRTRAGCEKTRDQINAWCHVDEFRTFAERTCVKPAGEEIRPGASRWMWGDVQACF